ncbi:MAG: hypothetical protein IIW10_03875, partial [Spirochaetaceae bacterium]|nr:hypothetical protein [Spirochaetaceae bacterium]
KMAKNALDSGAGFNTLVEMVKAQGGDPAVILDTDKFEKAKILREVKAEADGYISKIDTEGYGLAALVLGAGRNRKEDEIDFSVGIKVFKKTGEFVKKGETFATIFANSEDSAAESEKRIRKATEFCGEKPEQRPLILGRVE